MNIAKGPTPPGVSRNSRSRPFPRMTVSHFRSRIVIIIIYQPFWAFFFLRSTSPIAFWFCILKVKYAADLDALQWQGITLGHNLTYVEELPVALVETREKTFFCPKRDHTCQIGQIGKGRETLLHGVYGSRSVWFYLEKSNLAFWPKILLLTCPHV